MFISPAHRILIGKKMPARKRTLVTKHNMYKPSHRVPRKIGTILYSTVQLGKTNPPRIPPHVSKIHILTTGDI